MEIDAIKWFASKLRPDKSGPLCELCLRNQLKATIKDHLGYSDTIRPDDLSGVALSHALLDQPTVADAINAAVLAERERCAKIARDAGESVAREAEYICGVDCGCGESIAAKIMEGK